ncbi:TetR family transcriptional regulator [Prosthecomicrobium pneumaticum]|uniref:AcrR family transcriptional regulator n=1 Tax=Prosthecomicrobium pneumaticum TaxID=81895 RepID=A0A7W9CVJ6_9HYPH|nr:AcrR family transcriptional regulator [Prosthecomicrobium pneumaticum]
MTETAARRGRPSARQRILEAAEAVAQQVGPAHLSLDAVAERAGVSKGGLLYHFPSKQALIVAVIEQHIHEIECARERAEAEQPPSSCPVATGHIDAFAQKLCSNADGVPPGILAALAETPALLEPFRDFNRRFVERLDRSKPNWETAMIAFYVVEGMKALQIFGADPLDLDSRRSVLDAMRRLVGEEDRPAAAE